MTDLLDAPTTVNCAHNRPHLDCRRCQEHPSTSYNRGCRCPTCRAYTHERSRRRWAAEPKTDYIDAKPLLAVELSCLACGHLLAVTATDKPDRRERVAALQCSNPACRRMHAFRVFLDIEPCEGKLP